MSEGAQLDLDAYLARIGWTGGREPTFATLAGILRAHVRTIPFENLDVLLGRAIDLDLRALQRKLVHARRGGYCFEHATLFAAVLEALGFAPLRHSARV
ncbi:MAG TPA: arylamine N-acetyltransferase, partial [Rhodanobacteraceae bacterium]|nr:arylamine N-acetyltransferase [Rhodanobacteraceae bacterium]